MKAPDETSEPKRISIAGQLLVLQYREGFAPCDGDAQRSYTRFVHLK